MYHDGKLGIAATAIFTKKARASHWHPDFKVRNIHEWLNNQFSNQVNRSITKQFKYEITKSFQVDILW